LNKITKTEQRNLRFRNVISGVEVDSIWQHLLAEKLWRSADFLQHEENVISGYRDRAPWKPVLTPWITLEPGMFWSQETSNTADPVYRPVCGSGTMEDFLDAALRFFECFNGRHIAVQLSGGFDSSLIIGLLRHFGIPYSLVGLRSDRYEFRTERYVQEKLASAAESVEFIDECACLPYTDINAVPPHQVPDLLSLNFSQDDAMARACRRLGVDVLLSGGGGDNLLAETVPESPDLCEWRPQIFTDPFPVNMVYKPRGIDFLSFFGDQGIVDAIYRLRCGQGFDSTKLWARNFFRDFLPSELSNYTYCADFWGRDIDGLQDAIPLIRDIHSSAAESTGSDYFADERLEELLKQDFMQADKILYNRIDARVSSALWVNSLERLLLSNKMTQG